MRAGNRGQETADRCWPPSPVPCLPSPVRPRLQPCFARTYRYGAVVFRRAVILIGLSLLFAALAGCGTTKRTLTPQGEVVVDATGEPRRAVTVKLHNLVRINLPPVRTEGHVWTIVANDYRFLQPHEALSVAADGSAKTSFIAVRQGRRPIRFFALPPGAAVVPSQAVEVVVTIQ